MRRWLIRFVSGREETIDGSDIAEDRALLKITTEPRGGARESWVTFPLVNVESYREVPR